MTCPVYKDGSYSSYSACFCRRRTTQLCPLPVAHSKGVLSLSMDVFGASWGNRIVNSCFFPASILLSTGELWNAIRCKKRKGKFKLRSISFATNSEPRSKNLVWSWPNCNDWQKYKINWNILEMWKYLLNVLDDLAFTLIYTVLLLAILYW